MLLHENKRPSGVSSFTRTIDGSAGFWTRFFRSLHWLSTWVVGQNTWAPTAANSMAAFFSALGLVYNTFQYDFASAPIIFQFLKANYYSVFCLLSRLSALPQVPYIPGFREWSRCFDLPHLRKPSHSPFHGAQKACGYSYKPYGLCPQKEPLC